MAGYFDQSARTIESSELQCFEQAIGHQQNLKIGAATTLGCQWPLLFQATDTERPYVNAGLSVSSTADTRPTIYAYIIYA